MRSTFLAVLVLAVFTRDRVQGQSRAEADTFAVYFDEIKSAAAEHKSLWNYDLYAPLLFVQRSSRKIYANVPDSAGSLKKEGSVFTGILPATINISNTSLHWSGIDWAMVALPLPRTKNNRLILVLHELFHRAQPHLGFKSYNPANNHLDEKDGRISLRLELEALKDAVLAPSEDERTRCVSDALTFRLYRRSLFSKSDASENALELNEGLAEYTGMMSAGLDETAFHKHLQETLYRFLQNPTFVRSFAYQTIPLYGYLLHLKRDEWNRDITDSTDLTKYFLDAYGIRPPGDLKNAVSAVADKYDGKNILSEETARKQRTDSLRAEYKKEFLEQPHLDIPFEKMNISFNPDNIMPLEDKGTVYPDLRITDNWGVLTATKGALVGLLWEKVTVTAPTKIGNAVVEGNGWRLELQKGYSVKKDGKSKNYFLKIQ
ncbi:MAG TPA: hypothetical protein VLY03_08025 [Bacteroidota bacterium]|nr:hypothetical protein [Bacteroidota bacterium]